MKVLNNPRHPLLPLASVNHLQVLEARHWILLSIELGIEPLPTYLKLNC